MIPRAEVKDYLNANFVALADDCDEMAPEVRALGAANMPWARSLPFLILTDADGKWLGGASGATTPTAFLEMLRKAVEGK